MLRIKIPIYREEISVENTTIVATLIFTIFIIIILEILRYFRTSKRFMGEFEELKRRVEFLEDKINENKKITMIIMRNIRLR